MKRGNIGVMVTIEGEQTRTRPGDFYAVGEELWTISHLPPEQYGRVDDQPVEVVLLDGEPAQSRIHGILQVSEDERDVRRLADFREEPSREAGADYVILKIIPNERESSFHRTASPNRKAA